jgi:hypothetical protein
MPGCTTVLEGKDEKEVLAKAAGARKECPQQAEHSAGGCQQGAEGHHTK